MRAAPFFVFASLFSAEALFVRRGFNPPATLGCGESALSIPRGGDADSSRSLDDDSSDRDEFFKKNIFILCDGTWCGEETNTRTNIRLLYEFVANTCGSKRCKYFEGVGMGASEIDYFLSGAFALDMGEKILQAYMYVVKSFEEGDRLWLFGLSRGAFTVRYVAAMIDRLGIVSRAGKSDAKIERDCRNILKLYQEGAFQRTHPYDFKYPPVKFMGLFDTVKAEGFPAVGRRFPYPYEFSDYNVGRAVQCVYQCSSIHDQLLFFQPCTIDRDVHIANLPNYKYNTEEVWAPGCHYDVGRQYFRFGYGFLAKLTRSILRFSLLAWPFRPLPDIKPNEEYADLALDWIVAKMVDNGFPNATNYPVVNTTQTSPSWRGWLPPLVWEGDVYEKLMERYRLQIVKHFVLGFRVLPREFTMIEFEPRPIEYPSEALEKHNVMIPGGKQLKITVPYRYEIPNRIQQAV